MFATTPELLAPSHTGSSRKPDVGAPAFEAGASRSLVGAAPGSVKGPPAVDPSIYGLDPSDFEMQSGGVGGKAERKAKGAALVKSLKSDRPMNGEHADVFIDGVDAIRDMVADKVNGGMTGKKLVRFHEDRESFVDAWYRYSLAVQSAWVPDATPEELEDRKRRIARENAERSGGFTHPNTGEIHIYTRGIPAFVTIHELMHAYSGLKGEPYAVTEGGADFFTRMVCDEFGIKFFFAYPQEAEAMQQLVQTVGLTMFATYFFKGADDQMMTAIDTALGAGSWKRYKRALRLGQYTVASSILLGAAAPIDAARRDEDDAAARADVEEKEDRKNRSLPHEDTWAKERTDTFSMRPNMRETRHGMEVLMIPRGGKDGFRSSFSATFVLNDGTELPGVIVEVGDERMYVLFPGQGNYDNLETLKLKP